MSTPNTATPTGRRLVRLAELQAAADSILTLGTISVQRQIHDLYAERRIDANELHVLQSEWNGVQDHLESFLSTLSSIRSAAAAQARKADLSFAHDGVRDPIPHCPTCSHDLELDADFRCVRCGSPS